MEETEEDFWRSIPGAYEAVMYGRAHPEENVPGEVVWAEIRERLAKSPRRVSSTLGFRVLAVTNTTGAVSVAAST